MMMICSTCITRSEFVVAGHAAQETNRKIWLQVRGDKLSVCLLVSLTGCLLWFGVSVNGFVTVRLVQWRDHLVALHALPKNEIIPLVVGICLYWERDNEVGKEGDGGNDKLSKGPRPVLNPGRPLRSAAEILCITLWPPPHSRAPSCWTVTFMCLA